MLEYPDLQKPSSATNQAQELQIFSHKEPFTVESGFIFDGIELCYSTYGLLNNDKSNVIWVCHALTANSNVQDWWSQLFGKGKCFDTEKYFIICVNVLGSCYGSTGPLSINVKTGKPYFHTFPQLTIRDQIAAFELLAAHLCINSIHTCIGGSLGGQQALEWAISNPKKIKNLIIMATNARTSPWGIALNQTQRMAIQADVTWKNNDEKAGLEGMGTARAIALLSYRSYQTYLHTQSDSEDTLGNYQAMSYQTYQADKFKSRFNAYSYMALTHMLDSHNVGRYRGGIDNALAQISAHTLIIGINSDLLFPILEQQQLHLAIHGSKLQIIDSLYGHDGFLVESVKIEAIIREFLGSSLN